MAPPDEVAVTKPTIISEALNKELAKVGSLIPEGKTGAVTVGASQTGVELGAAWRPYTNLTFSGYAARLWGTGGWVGAARGTYSW